MTAAVVTAAGSSVRMGGQKKEYRAFGASGTVLDAACAALADSGFIDRVVVVVPPGGEAAARAALDPRRLAPGAYPVFGFADGGSSRQASVRNALEALSGAGVEWVLIHDGARPWLDQAVVARVAAAARTSGAAIPVQALTETPKELASDGTVLRHLRRAAVAAAQTPQAFAYPEIRRAHELAAGDGREYTDDAEIWAAYIGPVATVPGSPANKKITFPEDLP
jgi:2-C-methyl-D-erythritol 4-phosphate cytidylyltransferase/2-C-methyl-D-erythritol 4-phosphate cytidylyltransferase/2-C-methyl-D-erythritol 2,4-cyclodiphosphate synthase